MNSQDNRPTRNSSGGFFRELALRTLLVFRLMGDKRVFPLLKLIPIGTLLYLIIPDLLPGPIDDAAVIGVGMSIFVELCPQYVVDEHKRALHLGQPADGNQSQAAPRNTDAEDVLEGEFKDVDASRSGPASGQKG